ncbi:MAG: T9SS type A sorting domain-containing protein [Bacteroidia bacterium]|nr:T9SS type A sorting domain-containing protein [Bacteroidia bacterium]
MKIKSFYFLLMFFTPFLTSAQYTLDWIQPCGEFNKISVMSVTDDQDNLIVTGYWQSYQIFTRKYDIDGNFLWEIADSSGMQSLYEKPIWINCDNNNNIYVVGKRYAIGSSYEYPDAIVAIKYNPSGTLLWRQIIPITTLIGSSSPGFNLRSAVDSDGSLYIASMGIIPSGSGFVLAKISTTGTIQYVNVDATVVATGFASMRLKDNRVIMTGSAGTQSAAPIAVWDTSGVVVWTALGNGAGGHDVETDDAGNVYLFTSSPNQVSSSSLQDMVLYKYDNSGAQLWKRSYDFNGQDFPTRMTLVNNKISAIGWGTNGTTSPYFDWKTFQTDTSGNLLWSNFYNGTIYNDEYPANLVATPTGEVIVTGVGGPSPLPSQSLSYIQLIILEYSNTGSQVWIDTPNVYGGSGLACMLASDNSLFAISYYNMTAYHYEPSALGLTDAQIQNPDGIFCYPNPAKGTAMLNFQLEKEQVVSVSVVNAFGSLVMNIPNEKRSQGHNTIPIDLSAFKPGIYFCHLKTETGMRAVKVIKD